MTPPSRTSRRKPASGGRPGTRGTWPAPRLIGAGVNGGPCGRDAAALGSLLARATGAELMLIGVHEVPLYEGLLPRELSWSALDKEIRSTLAQMRDALAPSARIVVHTDALVWRGLRHVVRLEHRDLLVVGSATDCPRGKIALGKTVRDLLTHLECPLAIAPSGLSENRDPSLTRIGVAYDGSAESTAALELGRSMASAANGALEVRGVVTDTTAGGLRTDQIVLEGQAITRRQLVSMFEQELAAVRSSDVPTRLEVETGTPSEVLRELSDQVDLLLIGSGSRSRAGRVGLGSTGRALLHEASCPVVILPAPAS